MPHYETPTPEGRGFSSGLSRIPALARQCPMGGQRNTPRNVEAISPFQIEPMESPPSRVRWEDQARFDCATLPAIQRFDLTAMSVAGGS